MRPSIHRGALLASTLLLSATLLARGGDGLRTTQEDWAKCWPRGRFARYTTSYLLAGQFSPDLKKMADDKAKGKGWYTWEYWKALGVKLATKGVDGSVYVGTHGAQAIFFHSYYNTKDEGLFWTQTYSPSEKMTITSDIVLNDPLGIFKAAARVLSPQLRAEQERIEKGKNRWELTSFLKRVAGKELEEAQKAKAKRDAALREVHYSVLADHNTETVTIKTDNPDFRALCEKMGLSSITGGQEAYRQLKGIAYGIESELMDRRLLLWAQEDRTKNRVTEALCQLLALPSEGGYTEQELNKKAESLAKERGTDVAKRWRKSVENRRDSMEESIDIISEMTTTLEEEGKTDAASLWKEIAAEDPDMWLEKKTFEGDKEAEAVFELHRTIDPYFAIWGGNDKGFAKAPGSHEEGDVWEVPASILAPYLHSDFANYSITGTMLIKRLKDETPKKEWNFQQDACYVFEIEREATINGRSVSTEVRLTPTNEEDPRLFPLEYSGPHQNLRDLIYVSKKGNLPKFAEVTFKIDAKAENKALDLPYISGLRVQKGSELLLKFTVRQTDWDDAPKATEANPFLVNPGSDK